MPSFGVLLRSSSTLWYKPFPLRRKKHLLIGTALCLPYTGCADVDVPWKRGPALLFFADMNILIL